MCHLHPVENLCSHNAAEGDKIGPTSSTSRAIPTRII